MALHDINDIRAIRVISGQIDTDDLAVYIQETEDIEVCEFLGDEMYYDILNDGSPYTDKYNKLLDGTDYVYGSYTIKFHGLKRAMAYVSLARYVENHGVHISKFGIVIKETEHSEPASEDALIRFIGNLRSTANHYFQEAKKYLDDNASDYTLWSYSNKNVVRGMRITKVSRDEGTKTEQDCIDWLNCLKN